MFLILLLYSRMLWCFLWSVHTFAVNSIHEYYCSNIYIHKTIIRYFNIFRNDNINVILHTCLDLVFIHHTQVLHVLHALDNVQQTGRMFSLNHRCIHKTWSSHSKYLIISRCAALTPIHQIFPTHSYIFIRPSAQLTLFEFIHELWQTFLTSWRLIVADNWWGRLNRWSRRYAVRESNRALQNKVSSSTHLSDYLVQPLTIHVLISHFRGLRQFSQHILMRWSISWQDFRVSITKHFGFT